MKIEVRILPQIRNNQLGDYYYYDDTLIFEIKDTGNPIHNKLILIHEIIEESLTNYKDISELEISKFDIENPELDEPGDSINAPYHREHIIASAVENILCMYLGINNDY